MVELLQRFLEHVDSPAEASKHVGRGDLIRVLDAIEESCLSAWEVEEVEFEMAAGGNGRLDGFVKMGGVKGGDILQCETGMLPRSFNQLWPNI
ncbi:hypothetical protein ACLOJK_003855 [Asimina triloba]